MILRNKDGIDPADIQGFRIMLAGQMKSIYPQAYADADFTILAPMGGSFFIFVIGILASQIRSF